MLGLSLDAWNNWMVASLAVGALAAATVGVSTFAIVKLTGEEANDAKKAFEEYKAGVAVEVGKANASAEIAKAEAAKANEIAAVANLELARLKTPRSLNEEQKARIAAAIKDFSGVKYDLAIVPGDQDSVDLLEMVDLALTQGKWLPIAWIGGNIIYDRSRNNKLNAGQINGRGVSLVVGEDAANSFPAAQALAVALNAEGIASAAFEKEGHPTSGNKDAIHVYIGVKP